MNLTEAYFSIDKYYDRIKKTYSTSSRRYSYERIKSIMSLCPEVCEYWILVDATYYCDRVKQIKVYHPPIVKNPTPTAKQNAVEGYCAYIVYLTESKIIKVGQTNNFNRRRWEIMADYGNLIPLHFFKFDTRSNAERMETILKDYFEATYPNCIHILNDRFEYADYTPEDEAILERAAEKLRKINWF